MYYCFLVLRTSIWVTECSSMSWSSAYWNAYSEGCRVETNVISLMTVFFCLVLRCSLLAWLVCCWFEFMWRVVVCAWNKWVFFQSVMSSGWSLCNPSCFFSFASQGKGCVSNLLCCLEPGILTSSFWNLFVGLKTFCRRYRGDKGYSETRWRLVTIKESYRGHGLNRGGLVDRKSFLVLQAHAVRGQVTKTELNNETATWLACGKEHGLKRPRLKNALDSRENQCRVFKTMTYSHFEGFQGQN